MSDFKLLMGTNTIADSTGVLTSHGKELIGVEVSDKGELLVNVEVYDSAGRHIAKLNHNAWAFNDASYKVRTQKTDLLLTDASGGVVLEVNAGSPGRATIRRARLYTPKGSEIKVTAEELVLPGEHVFRDCTFQGTGTAFEIGD